MVTCHRSSRKLWPLLEIYPEKNMIRKDINTRTSMFTAALFIIAKTWEQPKCPPTEEWVKKMWCVCVFSHVWFFCDLMGCQVPLSMGFPRQEHRSGLPFPTIEYYSAIRKNEIMPFAATWIDLEMIILSEVSQTEKEKYHMTSLICGI